MTKRVLLIIDPQVDFCEGGALAVAGGSAALTRVANMIRNNVRLWDEIAVTFDAHHQFHIGHPCYMVNAKGKNPDPFTLMLERDGQLFGGTIDSNGSVVEGEPLYCAVPSLHAWTVKYIQSLRSNGRYRHMFWPPHCLIGTTGSCMHPEIQEAIFHWERERVAMAVKVTKGSNYRTEHFGAIRAEVVDPKDPNTDVNFPLLSVLEDKNSQVFVAGLARGHCLANTVVDANTHSGSGDFFGRLTLLEDGTADVAGLQFLGDKFVSDAKSRGMKVCMTTDL